MHCDGVEASDEVGELLFSKTSELESQNVDSVVRSGPTFSAPTAEVALFADRFSLSDFGFHRLRALLKAVI